MDDLQYGVRDKRGNWAPNAALEIAPFWTGRFGKLGAFAVDYLWPWNAFHLAVTLGYWFLVIEPNMEAFRTPTIGWFLTLYAINAAGIFLMYGSIELFYYVKRRQGTRFKYNAKFPSENPSDVFWFKSQNIDNFLRSFLITIPLWTVALMIILYAYATGWATWLSWSEHWPWLVALLLLAPAWHEIHFFFIHRIIHIPLLYRWVHSVHHNSINPSPWSSMSMHPVEGFWYHSVALWYLLIPANPVCALFQLNMAAYGAINGHIGFDKLELGGDKTLTSHAYAHYLHHKYFEVNYGGDGLVPLDHWFGTWHDGTKAAEERMNQRLRRKKERLNARNAPSSTQSE